MKGPLGGLNQHGHLDPDVVAEFRAGLITDRGLAGRPGRAISAHLSACAACAALDARLAQVSTLLAAAPVPAVPDAVARRLDGALAALAAESQSPISTERPSPHPTPSRFPSEAGVPGGSESPDGHRPDVGGPPRVGSAPRVGGGSAGRRMWRLRTLAPAAATLAALAGVGYGLSQLSITSSTASGPTAGGAAVHGGARAPGAAEAPTAASGTASFGRERRHGMNSQSRTGTYSGGNQVVVVSSNLDYQPATWRQLVAAQLKASQTLRAGPASAVVTACVLNVAAGSPRLLVESARYNGTPATIVVLPSAGGDVGVVAGPDCSATRSDILARAVLSSGTSGP